MKKYIALIAWFAIFMVSCEDEPTAMRSNELAVYGPPFDIYINESFVFEAPLFVLNDTRNWQWSAEFNGAEEATGEGEFFEVTFDQAGTWTIYLKEGDREGSVEVEVLDP